MYLPNLFYLAWDCAMLLFKGTVMSDVSKLLLQKVEDEVKKTRIQTQSLVKYECVKCSRLQ
jgi:hypothetical protein